MRTRNIKKNEKYFYVRSVGMAYEYNKTFFDMFFRKFTNKKIIFKNISNPDLVIASHWRKLTDYVKINDNVPVVTWSGESFKVKNYDKQVKLNINSFITQNPKDLWIPYITMEAYENKTNVEKILKKKFPKILNREYNIAYVSSNCIPLRDNLFKILKNKIDDCHALGGCQNNFKLKEEKTEKNWRSLSKVYENYKLGFALENTKKEGYITEKILNVFAGGAIPIYWGDSKNLSDIFDKRSYIDISSFKDLNEAVDYICKIIRDKKKLQEYQDIQPIKKLDKLNNLFYYFSKIDKNILK